VTEGDAPDAATPRRSLVDRYLTVLPFAISALIILSILFWEASAQKTPTVFTDELEWTQISRAIASTGHAARRGVPISFKSLYAFVMAPFWWIHSTSAAYTALKYVNVVVMSSAAIPVYLLARLLVSRRAAAVAALGTLCTSAFFYAPLLLPEVLAYPFFALSAFLSVRALAGGGRRYTIAAIVACVIAVEVRTELIVAGGALALAAGWLWIVGPRGRRIRREWSTADHVGAVVLVLGAAIALNQVVSAHSFQWYQTTEFFMGRIWHFGLISASALAIGLGVLPAITGLAALWIPERRDDPTWRAFAAYLGASIVLIGTYTAVKDAYLSTTFSTLVEERNLIYLQPLLLVGTVVFFSARRIWLPGVIAATAFVGYLLIHYNYQLGFPYGESPGYGIAAMANRAFVWNQAAIRRAFWVVLVVALLVALLPRLLRSRPQLKHWLLALAAVATATWMLAGEVTSARGDASGSRQFVRNLGHPLDWVDRATNGAGVTYLGQQAGDDQGLWLTEFWNRSIKHVYTLDGTGPGPGPTLTPDLGSPDGTLNGDPGLDYVLASNGVHMIGRVVAERGSLLLTRIPSHPWRLKDAIYGRTKDGWMGSDLTYAYFGPEKKVGTLAVTVGRPGFCAAAAPKPTFTIKVGPVALNSQRAPVVDHPVATRRVTVANCNQKTIRFRVAPPVAVQIHETPLVVPTAYGLSDARSLGGQVGFKFTP
jgi:hypothetical protein